MNQGWSLSPNLNNFQAKNIGPIKALLMGLRSDKASLGEPATYLVIETSNVFFGCFSQNQNWTFLGLSNSPHRGLTQEVEGTDQCKCRFTLGSIKQAKVTVKMLIHPADHTHAQLNTTAKPACKKGIRETWHLQGDSAKKRKERRRRRRRRVCCLKASPAVLSMWPCEIIFHIQV
jgi:hypothetical protein